MRVAVIDLGSNSFRLLVADIDAFGGLQPVLREREMLHLGGALGETGHLDEGRVATAVTATRQLHDLAVRTGATKIIAVATAAIRSAANRDAIVARLSEAAGTEVRVLDGQEEARLGFIGVAASVALPSEPHLVLDLGGGSLEVTIGHGASVEWSTSIPLGVGRVHAGLVRSDPMIDAEVEAVRTHVRELMADSDHAVHRSHPEAAVAIGGFVRALAKVIAHRTLGWTPGILNQFYITADEVRLTMENMVSRTKAERLRVPGVSESRADQIGTAAIILDTVMTSLDLERLWVSYWGLREGSIIDEFGAREFPLGAGLRSASVARMADRFVPDQAHCAHVAHLASSLFAQTRRLHGLADRDRELLLDAALLHSIGMSVAFNGYARHGAYLLEHSELRGFSPNEIALLASLVRFHRRGSAHMDYAPYGNLTRASRSRADALIALLHVADVFDRALDQAISDVELRSESGVLAVRLLGDHPRLRRDWAEKAASVVEKALDVRLEFDSDQLLDL